jgi:hypothetical protein
MGARGESRSRDPSTEQAVPSPEPSCLARQPSDEARCVPNQPVTSDGGVHACAHDRLRGLQRRSDQDPAPLNPPESIIDDRASARACDDSQGGDAWLGRAMTSCPLDLAGRHVDVVRPRRTAIAGDQGARRPTRQKRRRDHAGRSSSSFRSRCWRGEEFPRDVATAIVSPNVKRTLSGNPPRIPVRRGGTPRSARRGRQSVHVPPIPPRPRAAPLGVSGHDTTPVDVWSQGLRYVK